MIFLKNRLLLAEDSNAAIVFDFGNSLRDLEKKITSMEGGSLLGLVGPYGSGKSTALNKIKEKHIAGGGDWIEIDAWEFPDRKELWEGVIYKIGEHLGESIESTSSTLEGKSGKATAYFAGLASALSGGTTDKLGEILTDKTPIVRIAQLKALVEKLLADIKDDTIIVLEDIDRSGEAGKYFLESFGYLIKNCGNGSKIKAVVPIGTGDYRGNMSSYLKCLDYIQEFSPSYNSIEVFLDELIKPETYQSIKKWRVPTACISEQTVRTGFNKYVIALLTDGIVTPRELKHALRNADITCERYLATGIEAVDFRMAFLFEIERIVKDGAEGYVIGKTKGRTNSKTPLGQFLYTIASENLPSPHSRDSSFAYDFKEMAQIIHYTAIMMHESYRGESDAECQIPDFYL